MLTEISGEGAHAYIKLHLGGKKTKGDLMSTWLKIEAALLNQLDNISSRTALGRDTTPLTLDNKLFQGVFGVVTWYALRLVQYHCEQQVHPLKSCTGTLQSPWVYLVLIYVMRNGILLALFPLTLKTIDSGIGIILNVHC